MIHIYCSMFWVLAATCQVCVVATSWSDTSRKIRPKGQQNYAADDQTGKRIIACDLQWPNGRRKKPSATKVVQSKKYAYKSGKMETKAFRQALKTLLQK